jgi:hypothetical protein
MSNAKVRHRRRRRTKARKVRVFVQATAILADIEARVMRNFYHFGHPGGMRVVSFDVTAFTLRNYGL